MFDLAIEGGINLAEGLFNALFVFDEGDADITLAVGAETSAGSDGDVGIFEKAEAKIEGTLSLEVLVGDLGPDEHAGAGGFDIPADLAEPFDENIAALFIDRALLLDELVAVAEGHNGGDLDGGEVAVVVVTLDGGECADHFMVAAAESDAPAGHIVGFGHGGEFDADILSAVCGQERGGFVAVEAGFTVGEIGNEKDVVFFGQRHGFDPEFRLNGDGAGVVRVVEDNQLGARLEVLEGVLNAGEEGVIIAEGDGHNAAASEGDGIHVDGVGGVSDDDGIAGGEEGEHEVGEAFLGADGGDDFAVGIELDAVAAFVFEGDFAAEVVEAHGDGVAVIAGVFGGFGEFVDDEVGGGVDGVAHAQVDDIGAGAAFFRLEGVEACKKIRGKTPESCGDVDGKRFARSACHGVLNGWF